MSSLRKHFPHFNLQKQPTKGTISGNRSTFGSARICPKRKASPPIGSDLLQNQHQHQEFNAISFKTDLFNCLEICSAYITALNTLCSTGAILAQSLIQVFSRDLNTCWSQERLGPGLRVSDQFPGKPSPSPSPSPGPFSNHPFPEPNGNQCNFKGDPNATYYEMAEQFLGVWENMSVSTAGASAKIKTETLMTLQDVINKLEADSQGSGTGSEELNGMSLANCIQAAKCCLLSYVELQTQFSHKSWKSLSKLSETLKSDTDMIDLVKNIEQHFVLNDPSNGGGAGAGVAGRAVEANNSSSIPPNCSPFVSHESLPGLRVMPPQATSWNSLDSACTSSDNSDVFGLEDAINLLSLRGPGDRGKKKKSQSSKRNHAKTGGRVEEETEKGHGPGYGYGQGHGHGHGHANANNVQRAVNPANQQYLNRDIMEEECNDTLLKQSTWPGRANERGFPFYNDWSLWPNSEVQVHRQEDSFCDNFQVKVWNGYAVGDQSSTSCSASGASDESIGASCLDLIDGRRSDMFSSLNNFLDNDTEAENNNSLIAEAANRLKRLSCSSDGLNLDPGQVNLSPFGLQEAGGIVNAIPLDVRIAKTSTWPLKQSSGSNWGLLGSNPMPLGRDFNGDPFSPCPTQHSLTSASSMWPFEGPKTPNEFTLFDNNINLKQDNF